MNIARSGCTTSIIGQNLQYIKCHFNQMLSHRIFNEIHSKYEEDVSRKGEQIKELLDYRNDDNVFNLTKLEREMIIEEICIN